jgi:hypothetical protein
MCGAGCRFQDSGLRALLAPLALCIALGACQSERDDRKVFEGQGFSMTPLDGWSEKNERGSLVLVGPRGLEQQRNTIAIRSVPVEGHWTEKRTAKLVVPATRKVVGSLPGAELHTERALEHERFEGRAFDLTFAPRKKQGERYDREHVVLVGKRRVLHVVHTAPKGMLIATQAAFDDLVESLREEG